MLQQDPRAGNGSAPREDAIRGARPPDAEAFDIDPATLRARPVDAEAMLRRAEELAAQSLQEKDVLVAARLASQAAMLFVMVGRLEGATPLFAFALARQSADRHPHARTVTEIRLAQLHQAAGRFMQARAMLDDAVARCRTVPAASPLLDFALQHLGKVMFDAGDYAGALVPLREALALRRAAGAAELVASTELAIATVTRALAAMQGGGGER